MRSDRVRRALISIDDNIALARRFVEGMTFDDFEQDERTIYAVTRCLEIISEASRRLPDDLKSRHAAVPWSQIAGAGNVYRHDYEGVLSRILWHTVQHQLEALRLSVRDALTRSDLS